MLLPPIVLSAKEERKNRKKSTHGLLKVKRRGPPPFVDLVVSSQQPKPTTGTGYFSVVDSEKHTASKVES